MSIDDRTARPAGFWVALPEGWVTLDVDPATSAANAGRLLDLAGSQDERIRANRVEIEQMLTQLASDSATNGIGFCACFSSTFDDLAVQASLTIAVNTLDDGANELSRMHRDLTGDEWGRVIDVVDLDAGPAVRRAGRRRQPLPGTEDEVTFLSRQFYVAVPGTTAEVALLSFASPTLALEDELNGLFDGMAASFRFTW